VARTAQGDFIMTGYTTSLAIAKDDPKVIKIDAGDEVQQTRVIPVEGVNHTLTGEQTTDGGFILGEFSEFSSNGARGALLVKMDRQGNLEWLKSFFSRPRGGVWATPSGQRPMAALS
jgi:hypothetical protein